MGSGLFIPISVAGISSIRAALLSRAACFCLALAIASENDIAAAALSPSSCDLGALFSWESR